MFESGQQYHGVVEINHKTRSRRESPLDEVRLQAMVYVARIQVVSR